METSTISRSFLRLKQELEFDLKFESKTSLRPVWSGTLDPREYVVVKMLCTGNKTILIDISQPNMQRDKFYAIMSQGDSIFENVSFRLWSENYALRFACECEINNFLFCLINRSWLSPVSLRLDILEGERYDELPEPRPESIILMKQKNTAGD